MTTIDTMQGQITRTDNRNSARAAFRWLFSAIKDIRDGQRALYGNHHAGSYSDAYEAPYDRVIKRDPVAAIHLLR